MRPVRAPPIIHWQFLPEDDKEVGWTITHNLVALCLYHSEFEHALGLFDHITTSVEAGSLPVESRMWLLIPARDGAITLYHFGMTLRSFEGLLRRSKLISGIVDTQKLRVAGDAMAAHFPDFYAVRQGVAHVADHSITPERRAGHSIEGPAGPPHTVNRPYFARNVLQGRELRATVEGKMVSYSLSDESVTNLGETLALALKAFQPLADEMHRLSLEALSQKPQPRGPD